MGHSMYLYKVTEDVRCGQSSDSILEHTKTYAFGVKQLYNLSANTSKTLLSCPLNGLLHNEDVTFYLYLEGDNTKSEIKIRIVLSKFTFQCVMVT